MTIGRSALAIFVVLLIIVGVGGYYIDPTPESGADPKGTWQEGYDVGYDDGFAGAPKPKEDTDGDGIPDEVDLCPDITGTAEFSGCRGRLNVASLWSGSEEANFLQALDAFTEESGILIEHFPQSTEQLQIGFPTQLAAERSVFDVVVAPWPAWIRDLGEAGSLEDVTDLVDTTKFGPGYLSLVTSEGNLYGTPFKAWAKPGFWYKRSFFAANGLSVPQTWNDFKSLLATIAEIPGIQAPIASGDGVGWPLSDTTEAFIIGRGSPQLQLDLIDGEVSWLSSEVRAVFEDLVELLEAGYFSVPDEWTGQIAKLWNEEYGIYFMGNWMTTMPQVEDLADLGFFAFPGTTGTAGGGDWAVVPAFSENIDQAKELLEYLSGADAQEIMVRAGGFLATNTDVPADAYSAADKEVVDFLATVQVVTDLDDAIGGEFQATFWDQLKLLWVDPGALDDVLQALEDVAP
ncbi:MAG: ABC transporter substrate-binding protein [Thermoplasmata archaeon]